MNEQPNKGGRPPLPEGARADFHIHLRVTRRRKAAYVRAAVERKATLAKWCFEALDRESGYAEGGDERQPSSATIAGWQRRIAELTAILKRLPEGEDGCQPPARTSGQRWLKESTGEYFVWDGKQWVKA